MTGQITGVVRSGLTVTGSVLVNEGPGRGLVEYTAVVPAVDSAGSPLSAVSIKDALVVAWQAQRAARPQPSVDLTAQVNGTVTL